MKEQYRLAHNLIDMAEEGAPLSEIADILMRLKRMNEDQKDESGMLLAIVVPVQLTKAQMVERYPLVMYRKDHTKYIAVSWQDEQQLRKLGYVSQRELEDEKSK